MTMMGTGQVQRSRFVYKEFYSFLEIVLRKDALYINVKRFGNPYFSHVEPLKDYSEEKLLKLEKCVQLTKSVDTINLGIALLEEFLDINIRKKE